MIWPDINIAIISLSTENPEALIKQIRAAGMKASVCKGGWVCTSHSALLVWSTYINTWWPHISPAIIRNTDTLRSVVEITTCSNYEGLRVLQRTFYKCAKNIDLLN